MAASPRQSPTPQQQPAGSGANPCPAAIAMAVGNVVCAVGLFLGFLRLSDGGDDAIKPVALLSVGALGIVSFVRHAILHRSDAARMRWDIGRTDNFQIEVGMANLAWGVVAVMSVLGGWETAAHGALTAVFGLYLLMAAAIHVRILLVGPVDERRPLSSVIPTVMIGCLLTFFAVLALVDADASPF
jgi:hypothetical protein